MKTQGGRTPTEITPSPREDIEDSIENLKILNIEPITRVPQTLLRRHCLERDGNKCVLSGHYSLNDPHPNNVSTSHLEAAHIIPFALGLFQANDNAVVDRHAIIWVNLRRYFPALCDMSFTSEQINLEKNILMLDSMLHKEFGGFRLAFKATSTPHRYKIKTFKDTATVPKRFLPKNRTVNLRVHKGEWDLPDPELLNIHACIAEFLHLSGQAEVIDKILQNFGECGGLAPDGSSNLEDLLAASALSLLPTNINQTLESLKSTEKHRSYREPRMPGTTF